MSVSASAFSSSPSSPFGFPPSGGATAQGMLTFHGASSPGFLLFNRWRISSSRRSASDGGTSLFPLRRSAPLSRRRAELSLVASAADSGQTSSAPAPASPTLSGDKAIVPDTEFSLAKVSFGVIGLAVGGTLLSYGFGAYFSILPGSEWSAIMLTYGFPLGIIGMALKYAELKPVPCITYSDAEALREKCATPILKQVRSDVTRYRYGDEQHLDEALKRIFQYGQGGGIPRRSAPRLQAIREEVTVDGKYSLVLVFEAKALKLSDFERRQAKFASFFGPGIASEIGNGENDLYEVRLVSQAV